MKDSYLELSMQFQCLELLDYYTIHCHGLLKYLKKNPRKQKSICI